MRLGRILATIAIAALCVGVWATTAQAELRSLTGNARFQIGGGLPIPIFMPGVATPNGDVNAIPGALVSVGGAGKPIRFLAASQLTHNVLNTSKRTQGVFLANTMVFQVATNLAVAFPASPGTLSSMGRSGPSVVTWCPGTAVPVAGAPACAPFPNGGAILGGIRYTATGSQFGGPLVGRVTGLATVALRGGAGGAPGLVSAINAYASPSGNGVIGGAFNGMLTTMAAVPVSPNGTFVGTVNALGTFTTGTVAGTMGGAANGATSYGAPWTTGRITVLQPSAAGSPETFTLTGTSMRSASGVGDISLVAGAVSARILSGPNANRGWLNLTINRSVPLLPPGTLVALAGLIALGGGYMLRRQRMEAA